MQFRGAYKPVKIRFKADSGEEIGWFNLEQVSASPEPPLTRPGSPFLQVLPQAWQVLFVVLPGEPLIVIQKQGRHFAVLEADGNQEIIGEFYCHLVDPPPLTPERVAAIKSNPLAPKAVRAVFGCALCPSKCRVYAALERMPAWYEDIPEHFACECGKTQFDLSTVKRNFFALLYHRYATCGEIRYVPLYQRSSLDAVGLGCDSVEPALPLPWFVYTGRTC